ncbi:tyrosine-protein phosphatase non-receptor type 9-like isoform X5 [Eriocheir sinensis]|uniref:tyrosine-protein phosphatase non-receptor type 9-like isoform X5 n=1 Tax=Eriocheir sinensis TaxID=95602 RepID=UPI0021C75A68|nr:tyrosine-protein phosphatase non-receptor type 9-like isoform X5 [Eriocheir sinensis]XP_050721283.1 tyrosine-protein phosphatase non-receptor type 9-like isoform X5 [Eriocheir sinensis]XP_050721284.1 tyrosine-protein phosphatase non-receptor type 9-like isoform X5 [Eriocheir sinensis]
MVACGGVMDCFLQVSVRRQPPGDQATKEFVEKVNELRRSRNVGPLSWNTAVKFLMARKFDVSRAVSLYEQHEATRHREGLVNLNPTCEPLLSELATGKFTILPVRDESGAAIAVFTARLHDPRATTQQTTLQGVVYQLDAALESTETQRCGLVFIYDMTESAYQNFDYQLSQKILTLLKGGYPARLKKVLIVTAPLWFRAPFKVLRLFVREKLRDRVYTVSLPELINHIPVKCMPVELGGDLYTDHKAWLLKCQVSMTNRDPSTVCEPAPPPTLHSGLDRVESGENNPNMVPFGDQDPSSSVEQCDFSDDEVSCCEKSFSHDSNDEDDLEENVEAQDGRLSGLNGTEVEDTASEGKRKEEDTTHVLKGETSPGPEIQDTAHLNGHVLHESGRISGRGSPLAPPSSGSSGFSDDDSLHCDDGQGFTLEEFVRHLRDKGRQGLYHDYTQIKSRPPDGTFENSRKRCNQVKNRYTDVLCFDRTRVVLAAEDEEGTTDYINANYVDGYKQKRAFISTQGPLPGTFGDFWRMIWEQKVCVVVMTTRAVERGRTKCGQYWPLEQDASVTHSHFTITNTHVYNYHDYTVTALTIVDNVSGEERRVEHMQFTSWPDYGVPDSAMAMLEFLSQVRESQARLTAAYGSSWTGHPLGPPIVVHCSAGIGRTGTFCTLDICIRRLEETGTIEVKGTVEKIRSQRAYSIQMPDQYVFCHLALLEYALHNGKLVEVDLTGFEEDGSESD